MDNGQHMLYIYMCVWALTIYRSVKLTVPNCPTLHQPVGHNATRRCNRRLFLDHPSDQDVPPSLRDHPPIFSEPYIERGNGLSTSTHLHKESNPPAPLNNLLNGILIYACICNCVILCNYTTSANSFPCII